MNVNHKTNWNMEFLLKLFAIVCFFVGTFAQNAVEESLCPPQELILPCRCAQKTNEIQIWCSHSDLPRVLNGIKSVAKFIDKPIDELILENNQLPSLPSRFFGPLRVVRLMLRNNGVERLATGWLNGLESSLVEIFIVERTLRSLPFDSLIECKKLQAVTIQSEHLKRAPSFATLIQLRYIKIQSAGLMELPPYGFVDLRALETVYIGGSPKLNRMEAGLFQNLEQLKSLNCNANGISWIHLRAFTNLPTITAMDLSHNEINDAGMVGRAIKDLSKLETLRIDHNYITTLSEGSFVDLESLKELYLNDNNIAEIHHGAFHKTPQLKLLHLENNFLRRVHPESFLQTSGSGVEYLHLQHNEISNIDEVKSLLDALPMLKFLDLSHNKLEIVPFGSLRGHGSLEQLCLDHNYISRIERDAFMAMPGLRELRLKNNSLSEDSPLPFWNLPGLKGLDLSENKFAMLNDTLLIGLPSLRRLDLSNNELTVIDQNTFAHNIYLETINVSMNDLVRIHPATFRFLNRLFEIDASDNKLEELLPGLPRIVERVNVEANKIASLPSSGASKMFDLPNLRMLNLGANQLHKIPKNAFKTLYQLRSLSLAQNRLRTIDEHSFAGLQRLEMLNLQDNAIVAVHERSFGPLSDLRDLNIQGNRLELLVDSIAENTHLERFDASRNNIMEISPNTFAKTRQLQSLDLSRNALRALPDSLATLTELRDIDISYNHLTNLPAAIIGAWRKLEELRASNNKVSELPSDTFTNLPALQYLDLSNNELKLIDPGSIKQLPELQELVLAENQLAELGERTFEDLPNLQALHLQNNYLRYISPKSFHRTNGIVYLNLSLNNFDNMEHMGLRSVRNLEVLDISNNKIRRVATNPLRNLDWLVELKLDNNHICKVQGEPFSSMPRLKVLTMRNNRMVSVAEPTFQHLRGNLAILDLDGNPLECSCNLLWLRAWFQETNSYPGPRCRDGSLLTELRFSKSDCDTSTDSRMNQVLLTNEHGDVFKRQITIDECDTEPPFDEQQHFNNENIPASPNESEYFYEQYIDYPLNETTAAQTTTTYEQAIGAVAPSNGDGSRTTPFNRNGSRNHTLLNYNQYKLHQMQPNHGAGNGSPFTFFGMPLPSLSNLWSGGGGGGNGAGDNARKSNSRADIDANGKSRLRNYRPRPGEVVDGFQFASNMRASHRNNVPNQLPNGPPPRIIPYPNQYAPNGAAKDRPYPTYYQTMYFDPKIEKGGFVPMLPDGGRKGFTPIQNPFGDGSGNETDANNSSGGGDGGDVQETVSTELKPNVEFDQEEEEEEEVEEDYGDESDDTKYSVRVPTVSQASSNQSYNVSSLKKGQNDVLTTSSTGIPLIRNSATPNPLHELLPRLTSTVLPHTVNPGLSEPNLKTSANNDQTRQNIQKISASRPASETVIVKENVPSTKSPIHSTTIPPAQKFIPTNVTSSAAKANPQPAIVPRTPPGRSVITKVFTSTSSSMAIPGTSSTQSPAPILPTAEEYLRTTSLVGGQRIGSGATTPSSTTQHDNDIGSSSTITYKKADLDWYYRNYNRTTLKEPHADAELNRLQANNVNGIHQNHPIATLFSAILAVTLFIGNIYSQTMH